MLVGTKGLSKKIKRQYFEDFMKWHELLGKVIGVLATKYKAPLEALYKPLQLAPYKTHHLKMRGSFLIVENTAYQDSWGPP